MIDYDHWYHEEEKWKEYDMICKIWKKRQIVYAILTSNLYNVLMIKCFI